MPDSNIHVNISSHSFAERFRLWNNDRKRRFYIRNHAVLSRFQMGNYIVRRKHGYRDAGLTVLGGFGLGQIPGVTDSPIQKIVYAGGGLAVLVFVWPVLRAMFGRKVDITHQANAQLETVAPKFEEKCALDPNNLVVRFGTKPLQFAVVDRRVSAWLWNANNDLSISKSRKRFLSPPINDTKPEDVIAYKLNQEYENGHEVFNEAKIRLSSDLSTMDLKDMATVKLQRTTYFDSLYGNESIVQNVYLSADALEETINRKQYNACLEVFGDDNPVVGGAVDLIPKRLSISNNLSNHFG